MPVKTTETLTGVIDSMRYLSNKKGIKLATVYQIAELMGVNHPVSAREILTDEIDEPRDPRVQPFPRRVSGAELDQIANVALALDAGVQRGDVVEPMKDFYSLAEDVCR
jgi:hypothetical protein